ncbi:hypothetical protein IX39_19910 [Chryseobacterium formosense]|uniref:RNA polymerase sigma-70 region 2 domain-containing protein n=1 Tax=Chryseobacterium formosense TaxID=236814 RepID=A0A085YZC9_9FLAO|nr:hypothetical protein [Chryseobacterium formosense]KFE97542.1 hypothetical protein IX39_19910 [Chryseobacterium formosense]SFT75085.1 hypothetical protein SAMN05421857_3009 [Chryseobacterium formosense]
MTNHRPAYSDNELFIFLISRERKHFEVIYTLYSPVIYGFLIRLGLAEKYSEDILQQTFITIWNKPVPIVSNNKLSFLSWIVQITIESTKKYLENKGRKFIIHQKSYPSVSIEFTDVLEHECKVQHIA